VLEAPCRSRRSSPAFQSGVQYLLEPWRPGWLQAARQAAYRPSNYLFISWIVPAFELPAQALAAPKILDFSAPM
jgi:hypothetical protein